MALKDSVLNIVIKARDLGSKTLRKFRGNLKQVDETSEKAGGSIASLAKRFAGLIAAATGIGVITGQLRKMLATGDKFEKLDKQLTAVFGDVAQGQEAAKWIKQFTQDTPLQLQQVTETFTSLKNFGIDPLNGSMQDIVDQAAKLGGGYEKVEGISLALGQAWAKQKLQGEEILQLIERGVPVYKLLADSTGKSAAEIQKLSAAGALGRDAIKGLIDEMGKQSTGAAAANMSLLSGYISNLKDQYQLFLDEIAKSGALDYVKGQLKSLLETIKQMKKDGSLKELAKSISDGFITIAESSKAVVLAITKNIGVITSLGKAYAALKLSQIVGGFGRLASTMGGVLTTGTASAARATKLLNSALRAAPYVFLLSSIQKVASAYGKLKSAQGALKKSQQANAKTQAKAADEIKKFNKETGLQVTSLKEIINAQDAGTVAIDEYTGKWRLASDAITDAEKAHRKEIDAAKEAAQYNTELTNIFKGLNQTFDETQKKGNTVSESIAALGEQARKGGQTGIAALSLSLQSLADKGKATKQELKKGLGDYLASLSERQYTQFGDLISAEFEKISKSTGDTANRLSFMKTLLEADLTAAAKRAGVDIGAVLDGVDEKTKKGIQSFTDLAESVKASGKSAEDSNKLISAGLLETLKSLDTSEEIDATKAAIKKLGKDSVLTSEQVKKLLGSVDDKAKELKKTSEDSADSQTHDNKRVTDSVKKVSSSLKEQEQQVKKTGGAAAALAGIYNGIRDSVASLGPAAEQAFDKIRGTDTGVPKITGEFADLKQKIADTNSAIAKTSTIGAGDFSNVASFVRELGRDAATVTKRYYQQKLSLEQLKKQYDSNNLSVGAFVQKAQAAANSSDLLGQQDLSYLRQAIADAQSKMESFRQSTEGTLNSLQSELAQLEGQKQKVAQLDYEQRVQKLQAQLDKANKTGDQKARSNAQQALNVAKQIYQVKRDQIDAQQKADAKQAEQQKKQQQQEAKKASQPKAAPAPTASPAPAPSKTTRVVIEDANGSELNVDTEDPDALLKLLARKGRLVGG